MTTAAAETLEHTGRDLLHLPQVVGHVARQHDADSRGGRGCGLRATSSIRFMMVCSCSCEGCQLVERCVEHAAPFEQSASTLGGDARARNAVFTPGQRW